MRRHNVLSSPQLTERKKQRRKSLVRKALLAFFLFLAMFAGLGFLSRWQKMNIKDIEVLGNKVADTDTITELAQKEIGGYYLWLYPKTNFLFYPKSRIEEKLRDQFKILNNISISVLNTRTLQISVSERTPAYTWCGDGLPEETTKAADVKCYFMDNSGYIFGEAPYFSGDVYFKFYGPAGASGPVGSYFLPDTFNKVVVFLKDVKNMSLEPVALLDKDDDSGNIELYLSSQVPPPDAPKIIFKKDFDPEKTAENLETALSTEPLQTDFKKKYASLVYIDLGFDNKVYYKFK